MLLRDNAYKNKLVAALYRSVRKFKTARE